ncbi:MAG: hypothetical protein M3540_11035 [Actinomycetota bacterium]|nr:hypothetical protein [Actinomycetota bacterium]
MITASIFTEEAGEKLDGIPLTAVTRRNDRAKYVSFIYGDCIPVADTGCAPPAEIQVWPACVRNLSLYARYRNAPVPDPVTIRGTTAAYFEDGRRLEVQTRDSTVVIFGASHEVVSAAASTLRGVNVADPATGALAPPVPGAVDGRIACS